MLFDLKNDPDEFNDLGCDDDYTQTRERMQDALNRWGLRNSQRTTISDATINARTGSALDMGVVIGYWDLDEVGGDNQSALKEILVDRPSKN